MNRHITAGRFFTRLGIVLFFLVIVAVGLYAPLMYDVLSVKSKVLNIYTFTDNFKPEHIHEFEELYKVRVNLKYFDSNEELLAKFKINRGEGYDIITPSDYMVELLTQEGLLHQFDKKKLPIFDELDSRLLSHYFDKNNDYSIPLMWFVYGIVYAKDILKDPSQEIGLDLVFKNPKNNVDRVVDFYNVCMTDDYREAVLFASLYLYGHYDATQINTLPTIQNLLVQQKNWIESYVNQDLRYYLLAGIIKVAMAPSVFVRKIVEKDFRFDFKIPREGGILGLENIAIPRGSRNLALAYEFINFILDKTRCYESAKLHGFNPVNKNSYALIDPKIFQNHNFFPLDEDFKKLYILHNKIPLALYEKLWMAVKSS